MKLRSRPLGQARNLFLALLAIAFFQLEAARASEALAAAGLDSYLSQLGYERVAFKKNERNEPLLETEIKARPHVLLADTGCGLTTLTPASAAGLKTLGKLGVTLNDSFLGRITNSSIALIDRLAIGRTQFLNQPARVRKLDMDYIRLQFDGVLGLDFFFRNFCVIDCYRRELFVRGARPSEKQRAAMRESLRRSGFLEAPLETKRFLSVSANINAQPVRVLVDTGDGLSALDESQAARLHLAVLKWEDPERGSLIRQDVTGNLVGLNQIGSHKVWVTMLNSFQVGSKVSKNISYGVANLKGWGISKPGSSEADLQGILGNELLRGHGAVIDFCNLKLWLRPEKARSN